ncbi:MAG TPA: DUF6600 domain-containing protein [Verrucomicrobiae bacterium]
MKIRFASKTLIALAVAVAAAAAYDSLANEQPLPPPAGDSALPDNIQPGSPVAQILQLAQAGVDASVIQNYIANCPTAFNLDADKIIVLTDAGVTSDMVNAMFAHDKNYLASINSAAASASPPPVQTTSAENNSAPTAAPVASAPPPEMTVNDFNTALAPYGQWVEVDGYGRCWRPAVMAYDATWQPYCDRGHWVYTDYGWYWNSDYSWGITFHYGRWFNTPQYGWCWWPDTVWSPSWVTWRSSSDYCGWAPLPPYTAYQPGVGFTYHGGNVAVSFGFGLAANCFTFVSIGNFCESHPRNYCVPRQQVTQIYNQTTIINNYNSHNRTIANNGVSVTVIGAAAHHPIQTVSVGTIVNANRHGWRGPGEIHPVRPSGASNANGSTTRQFTGTTGNRSVNVVNGSQHNNNYSAPAHSQANNNGFNNNGEIHRVQPTYTAPSATVSAPMNSGVSAPMNSGVSAPMNNNYSAPISQHSPSHGDVHQQVRQTSSQPSYTAPAATGQPQKRNEQRQNYNLAAPRTSAPAQAQNGSPNNGGKSQGWMVQNR